jgi:hypothetical protein
MDFSSNPLLLSTPARTDNAGRSHAGLMSCLIVVLAYSPPTVLAQWTVNSSISSDTGIQTPVAYTSNADGYTLEIYKDPVSAIRSRFTLNNSLTGFKERTCPTYQIDQGAPNNLSIDGAVCQSGERWAEFVLGRIEGDYIISAPLLSVMNGNILTFRFQLESGDFRETNISLSGSKRSMTTVIGETISVRAR